MAQASSVRSQVADMLGGRFAAVCGLSRGLIDVTLLTSHTCACVRCGGRLQVLSHTVEAYRVSATGSRGTSKVGTCRRIRRGWWCGAR